MHFISFSFVVFLPVVFFLYWFVFGKSIKAQNFFIVVASYVFYGWWDYRFLFLIFFSTCTDYWVSLKMEETQDILKRRRLLWTSLVVNLGVLGCFKYYNFFADSLSSLLSPWGYPVGFGSLEIILPVGISFYTFQTMGYSIDVYHRKLSPIRNFITFAAFVSFFPQLVAGPIERAPHFLPQFVASRKFDFCNARDGMRQMLWGLFKKLVIADNAASVVNAVFNDMSGYSGSTLWVAALCFSFQIYGDFSGYSDMAIGMAKLFGFSLRQNFNQPYFSANIPEFWRKWHISLSTWFRDYLYIPLGGNRKGAWGRVRNVMIVFALSGLWHGANWTFFMWGMLNGLLFLLSHREKPSFQTHSGILEHPALIKLIRRGSVVITFFCVTVMWVPFRSPDCGFALEYVSKMFSHSCLSLPDIFPLRLAGWVAILMLAEKFTLSKAHPLQNLEVALPKFLRWALYLLLIISIGFFSGQPQTFIYFQF